MEEVEYDIYILTDPRDSSVRYVGMSTNACKRYGEHLYTLYDSDAKKEWINGLMHARLHPGLSIIDHATGRKQARALEAYWIQHYIVTGANLVNKEVADAKQWNRMGSLMNRLAVRASANNPMPCVMIKQSVTPIEAVQIVRHIADSIREGAVFLPDAGLLDLVAKLLDDINADEETKTA